MTKLFAVDERIIVNHFINHSTSNSYIERFYLGKENLASAPTQINSISSQFSIENLNRSVDLKMMGFKIEELGGVQLNIRVATR